MVITCGIAIVELAVNMAVTGLGCTGRSSYNANVDDMQKALKLAKEDAADNDVPFYRVEDTGRLTKNDGTRCLSLIHIFVGSNAANMELLCRGMTFYGSVITSAVIILIGYIIRKKVAK